VSESDQKPLDACDPKALQAQAKDLCKDITVADILGKEPSGDISIRAQRVIMAPQPRLNLALGDIESMSKVTGALKPTAIVWNEQQICLMTRDRNSYVVFRPEIDPMAASFFKHEGTKKRGGSIFFGIQGTNVWEGEFEPVVFAKRTLFKFFKEHKTDLPDHVVAAIKNMQYSETKKTDEEMLAIDSDDKRTVTEERSNTNIPKEFTVTMQLTKEISADLRFEAKVGNVIDRNGYETKEKGIQLRCLNAREVLRDMMENYLAQLPADIPRYYGMLSLGEPRD